MAGRRLIEGGGNNFALHGAAHVGHLFRALIDQQNDEIAFRMVFFDGGRNILHQDRLTRTRRGNDQSALAFADRGNDIDDPAGAILLGRIAALHLETLFRIERGKVVEVDLLVGLLRLLEVDAAHIGQREVALAVLRGDDRAFDRITGADVGLLQNFGADIDVVGAGQIVRFRRAEEAEPIREHFEHALARDLDFAVCQFLEDGEQHVLRPHRGGVLDLELLGIGKEFLRRLRLEFAQSHTGKVVEHRGSHSGNIRTGIVKRGGAGRNYFAAPKDLAGQQAPYPPKTGRPSSNCGRGPVRKA